MTTALYRRYRPETFAEVVGQDHVTAPLRQALRSGQTNHAYLFSGPRGCGKTTSARILARCLNCAEGPTDTPCGVCPSCVELARGGPGSLDVVEIDAASHGGVDDARDLRERATFAPARDRYKIFILDEAHMVSPQGFNALLKIVEEPPEHVKFIFATTEPDKVIGTIRSRTHHYPFRLVPPDVMTGYLDQLCRTEGVQAGSGVLPLVVRAGGGSVRDSLSVLDQLIAGSGPDGLVYEDAVALLGYTHASLLDDLVEAISARDGASAFRVVERVISTGHEPRRFVEDLLERLRDLIVLAASGDAAAAVLRDVPGDQMARMQQQSAHLGAAELSRSADLVNAALSEMTGATSPRLHLELLMARLLLPALDDSSAGLGARMDRLEREGVRMSGGVGAGPAAPAPAPAVPVERVAVVVPAEPVGTTRPAASAAPSVRDAAPVAPDVTAPAARPTAPPPWDVDEPSKPAADERAEAPAEVTGADAARDGERTAEPVVPRSAGSEPAPARAEPASTAPERSVPGQAASEQAAPAPHDVPTAEPVAPPERPAGASGGGDTEMLRRRWPEVLDTLNRMKKATWVLISQNAQVMELDATTLRLGFAAPGLATAFRGGPHAALVQQAVRETLGFDVKVDGVLTGADTPAPVRPEPAASRPAGGGGGNGAPSAAQAAASWGGRADSSAAPGAPHGGAAGREPESEPDPADPWAGAPAGTPGGDPWAQAGPSGGVAAEEADRSIETGAAAVETGSRADAGPADGVPDNGTPADGMPSDRAVTEGADADAVIADAVIDEAVADGDLADGDLADDAVVDGGVLGDDVLDTSPEDDDAMDDDAADLAASAASVADAASTVPDPDTAWPEVRLAPVAAPTSGVAAAAGRAGATATAVTDAAVTDAAVTEDGWPVVAVPGGARAAESDAPAGAASPEDRVSTAAAASPAEPVPGAAAPDASAGPDDAIEHGTASASVGTGAARTTATAPTAASAEGRTPAVTRRPAATQDASQAPAWDGHGYDPDDPGPAEPPEDEYGVPPERSWGSRPSAGAVPAARPTQGDPNAPGPHASGPSRHGQGPSGQVAAPSASTAAPTPPLSGADRVRAAARGAAAGLAANGAASSARPTASRWADDEPSMDDPDIGSNSLSGVPLLVQMLGATVIEEQVDEGF